MSLLLSLLGAASEQGAWSALVGISGVSAEAVTEHGLDLARVAFVPDPGAGWVSVIGVLLDSVDVVVIRPPARLAPGEVRRLAARARTKSAVLIGYGPAVEQWPSLDLRLRAVTRRWVGAEDGYGRLRGRELEIRAEGRGRYARPLRDLVWFGEERRSSSSRSECVETRGPTQRAALSIVAERDSA
jgi:hypothetical protein